MSLPEPRRTRNSVSPTLPAGSVAVIVMWFVPEASGRLSVNVPSASATPDTEASLVSLRAMSVARDWVVPLISTALRLTWALSFGEVILAFGFELSRT